MLGNLGSSSDARIALLERRLMVPPSPAGPGEGPTTQPAPQAGAENIHSIHSIGSGLQQQLSNSCIRTPTGSMIEAGQSNDGEGEGQQSKKRRIHTTVNVAGMIKREGSATPSAPNRGGESPADHHTAEGGKGPSSTPGSKSKQKNTISRYFSSLHAADPPTHAKQESMQLPAAAATTSAAVQRALEKESAALR